MKAPPTIDAGDPTEPNAGRLSAPSHLVHPYRLLKPLATNSLHTGIAVDHSLVKRAVLPGVPVGTGVPPVRRPAPEQT